MRHIYNIIKVSPYEFHEYSASSKNCHWFNDQYLNNNNGIWDRHKESVFDNLLFVQVYADSVKNFGKGQSQRLIVYINPLIKDFSERQHFSTIMSNIDEWKRCLFSTGSKYIYSGLGPSPSKCGIIKCFSHKTDKLCKVQSLRKWVAESFLLKRSILWAAKNKDYYVK
jgi:hypothetical protein